jgi:WD40 repeat protein
MSTAAVEVRDEPYVGPRAFKPGEELYGREREARQVVDLLIAERIVLLYSPSGAGKTSFIQAVLISALQKEGFHVWPAMRVTNPELTAPSSGEANRRYVDIALSWLDLPATQPGGSSSGSADHPDFASALGEPTGPEMLIFDQFEEILTIDPTDIDAKVEFFRQIGAALRHRQRFALVSMREDYIGALDLYQHLVPTGLGNRFRLDLLGVRAAREAIQRPCERFGVHFSDEAATRLIDELRRVRVQLPDGGNTEKLGQHVEPLQLQVVCQRLWSERDPASKEIVLRQDMGEVGDVDSALGGYYADKVAAIARGSAAAERAIREWINTALITPQGLRGQALHAPVKSQGLDNEVIQQLVDSYVVRAERRLGATWYELAHDRLVGPIQQNNAAWFAQHLNPIQIQAELWNNRRRLDGLLLRSEALEQAEAWAAGATLTPVETDFLAAGRLARQRAQMEQRRNAQIRALAIAAFVGFLVAGTLGLLALNAQGKAEVSAQRALASATQAVTFAQQAATSEALAKTSEATAKDSEAMALAAATRAVAAESTARLEQSAAATAAAVAATEAARANTEANLATARGLAAAANAALDTDPELSTLLGLQAVRQTVARGAAVTREATEALQRAVQTSRVMRTISAYSTGVNAVAMNNAGSRLASASAAGSVKIWDWPLSTAPPLSLPDQPSSVVSLAFSPDGSRLAIGTAAGSVTIWDAASDQQRQLPNLPDVGQRVASVAFSPDGTQLAIAQGGPAIRILNAASGAVIGNLPVEGSALAVAYDPRGQYIAGGSAIPGGQGMTYLWTSSGTVLLSAATVAGVGHVAFSPDGTRLASAAFTVEVFDTNRRERLLNAGSNTGGGSYGLAFSPDGKWLASGGADRLIHLWDVGTGQDVLTLAGHADVVRGVAFDPSGQHLVSISDDTTMRVWDVMLKGFHLKPVQDVAFSPDGQRFATGDEAWNAEVWDTSSGAPLVGPLQHQGWVYRVAFDPAAGSTARLVTASADAKIRVWSGSSADPDVPLSDGTAELNDVSLSPNGALVAAASRDGRALIWDLSSASLLHQLPVTGGSGEVVYAVAFSPDGKLLATGSSDGFTKLWNVATETLLTPLGSAGHAIWRMAFSPNGQLLATANYKGTLSVWDVRSTSLVQALDAHAGRATAVAFSPDGRRIATAGEDHTAKVWTNASGVLQQEFTLVQGGAIRSVAFSPDGKWLATGGDDHEIHFYPVELSDLIALAKQRVTRQLTPDECAKYLPDLPCDPSL